MMRAEGARRHKPRPICEILRRFRRNERGATAVEFALIAMPFLTLLLAIFEVALNLWVQQVLETRVGEMSRRLYTGQFQAEASQKNLNLSTIQEAFREEICGTASHQKAVLFKCSNLIIDVRAPEPSQTLPEPIKNGSLNPDFGSNGSNYKAHPGARELWVVRAAVRYPVLFPVLGAGTSNLSASERLIMASTAFRTEPFEATP